MSVLDLERLLEGLPGDDPCGPNLEYDADFLSMERASQGKAEQQFGDTVVQAEEGDWRQVKQLSTVLLSRTKDVRVATYLTRALLRIDGLTGFCEGLALVKGLLEHHWDGVHPRLDPEDNDPTSRINAMSSVASAGEVKALRTAPLVSSPVLGRFSLRDIEIAAGKTPPPAGQEPPQLAAIEGAFSGIDLGLLTASDGAVERAITDLRDLEAFVLGKVGAGEAPDLSALNGTLKGIHQAYLEQLVRLGAVTSAGAAELPTGGPQRVGEVTSREDVIRLLDKACGYFERYEPSSPVPILLRRAKRLISKNFLDIVRDLAPDGLSQVEMIRGVEGD